MHLLKGHVRWRGKFNFTPWHLGLWEGAPGTNWIGGSLGLTTTLNA